MALTTTSIRKKLQAERNSASFGFEDRLKRAQSELIKFYGPRGSDASDLLSDRFEIAALVDATAPVMLAFLGAYWEKQKEPKTTTPLTLKLSKHRISWWKLALGLRCNRLSQPDWSEVGFHEEYTSNDLVNRFIGECSIQLADHYHRRLISSPYGAEKRSLEHDVLLREYGDTLPIFAKSTPSDRFLEHMQIASVYRVIEPTREKLSGEALVPVGEKAIERMEMGAKPSEKITLSSGKSVTLSEVLDFMEALLGLPTFGEWAKAQPPSKAVALARAIQRSGSQGIAMTANLSTAALGRAHSADKATGSAIQDSLRRHLTTEFGTTPDFYFVFEKGLGQKFHLHGAVSVDPTEENKDKTRAALLKLCETKHKPGKERAVDAKPLETPARWAGDSFKHPITSQSKTGIRSLIRSTRSLTREAKKEWEVMRQEQRDARFVMGLKP